MTFYNSLLSASLYIALADTGPGRPGLAISQSATHSFLVRGIPSSFGCGFPAPSADFGLEGNKAWSGFVPEAPPKGADEK